MYTAGILTISDSASKGDREDASGTVISRLLSKKGFDVLIHKIVPDEQQTISKILMEWVDEKEVDIIVTTGGTGLTPRDTTPEATMAVITRLIPGIPEAMRAAGIGENPRAMLSRAVAGVRKRTLIINLPGSPAGVETGLSVIMPILKHAIDKIKGDNTPCCER
ncbi:MAG: MogA/MoaB family molybdenum cofactor biosynthesis protein [Dissulfurimicrobium sp.]|uniref:MogA/MoaB family molybdenum cofactor biosynthesis protein n=1 Tax=Dissulfurimicrobium TaxID=1769732 RepID=UPI001EDC15F2|nr:MogA/MoaB family molybdenum cofactor biosynthesis protein [Dissulfurimicrobium hydrothermale]UKL13297.1 MogA/MoaB family molybdenum cofactor biosynthesis protein [Dissulfurimicrobium hydrothermale]